ncbi:DNA (cytosine-5-)-methyltransferase [Pedobacter frigiditerrae]|uniref:DNA cytosine methyltransferase n=1 Tax=Pedobacter frigiditerrae TaxID=2530452 RepID=UPI00292DDFCC|nr:DNA (cytosine-5-)-methyltransferase [Pedobacter frigiditerrae]
MAVPIIDIFAGPGGLGEGFSALINEENQRVFKIALSIEKDTLAHETLRLRSFYRQFDHGQVPDDYYSFIRGLLSIEQLYANWPEQADHAEREAWCGTLGDPDEKDQNAVSDEEVDTRIRAVLNGEQNWLLIGGPPCQAYSLVGRSRRQERILNEGTDKRVGLYKQYLRILAKHSPAVFVMENVKGILSAETTENHVFQKILQDLGDPAACFPENYRIEQVCPGYKIYSLVNLPEGFDIYGNPTYQPKQFVIQAEHYGIPQTRHRVILLGVRNDIDINPGIIGQSDEIPVRSVIGSLPRLRSGLSKNKDSFENWQNVIKRLLDSQVLVQMDKQIADNIRQNVLQLDNPLFGKGADYLPTGELAIGYLADWYLDTRIQGVLNHACRSHMDSDLLRYMFVACFGNIKEQSPKLSDFPTELLPAHSNVKEGVDDKKFADRFRVQLAGRAAKTITSHISKDGHYYIHPDPTQCRSLTVREAARIQTFPDNYYFCGPRTSQFHQVGNAVPPYLAYQIAGVVGHIFQQLEEPVAQENQ